MRIRFYYVMTTAPLIAVWIFCFLNPVTSLLQKARIDKARSDHAKRTQLGREATLKCFYTGNPPPEVHWTKNGKKLDNKCMFCVQKVEHLNGVSTLRVTPYRDTDFGDYKCRARNKLGFGHITMKLREDKTKNMTQCQRDRTLSRDPRLRLEFLPRCDPDGSYHVIQCSVHLHKCWCVDQSGHKIADAVGGHKGKHCVREKPKNMAVTAAIALVIGCVLLLLLFDIICHVTKNKGVINRLIRHRNKRRKYDKLRHKDEASKSAEKQDNTNSAEEP